MFLEKLHTKVVENEQDKMSYIPAFFRISNIKEKNALEDLLISKTHIKVFDTIAAQLKELVKSKKPSEILTPEQVAQDITLHLNGMDMSSYGTWVYYPWAERIVHLLDEEEFIELRTNRNKYKITSEEQAKLFTKKTGVIGLSVGQSVSLTMAIERTFGELRIADFDDLEITNLNRLRSGVHNMGLLKTVLVAREIAEIDPFLKVTCFHEGLSDENMEEFLTANGKLDVLIDECDSVDIKIKCRIAAKRHGIPVLMEASDRATIDIERFDLEPNRPILHGVIEHLDISQMKGLKTMEQKLPYILPIVGIDTMSPRLKASAVEIGQSISTWPQLASAVTLGGGITADICRKVLLDQLHVSGRYFIDIDELIADPVPAATKAGYDVKTLTAKEMAAIAATAPLPNHTDINTDEGIINKIIDAAIISPSAGNNQPWRLYFDGTRIFLFDDAERSAAFANFHNMITYLAMGTLLENIRLAAGALNAGVAIQPFPLADNGHSGLVAAITILKAGDVKKDELAGHIFLRHSNRKKGNGAQVGGNVIQELREAVAVVPGAGLQIIQDAAGLKKIAEITGRAEKLRMFVPEGHSDLFEREIRWDKESAECPGDGLDIRTLDLAAKDIVGFKVIKDARAIKLVSEWNKGAALENMTHDLVASASAVGLITMPSFTPENCIGAGIAAERAWLTACKHKLGFQPVLASILHFTRILHGGGGAMPVNVQKGFSELYNEFIKLFDLSSTSVAPLFLFRICYADEPQVKSVRLDRNNIYATSTQVK